MVRDVEFPLRRASYRWVILGAVTLMHAATSTAFQTMPALGPFLIVDLPLSRGELGLLVAVVQAGFIMAMLGCGLLVDRRGERLIFAGGVLIATTGALGLILRVPLWMPVPLILLGIGHSAVSVAGAKAILLWFPPRGRGFAMGFRLMATPLGGALAAGILPLLALRLGWVAAVSALAVFCLLIGLIVFVTYRDGPRGGAAGSATLLTSLRLLRLPALVLTICWSSVLVTGQFVVVTYLVLFFHQELGMPLESALPLLLVAQIVGAAGRMTLGWISDHLLGGKRKGGASLATGIGISLAVLLGILPAGLLIPLAPLAAAVAGFALIGWNALLLTMATELVPKAEAASGAAVYLALGQIGALAGPAAFGFAVDAAGSYRTAWLLLAGLLLLGLLLGTQIRAGQQPPGA